jgi:hypothetical protein
LDNCDAYLEYIESDAIKKLIDRIYSPNSEMGEHEQSYRSNDDGYEQVVHKIDMLSKK